MTTIVLQSGTQWGTFPVRSRSGVAGLLPLRHSGSTEPFASLDACALAFHGTFEHSLDAKNRLTVPARFRAALAGGVFLVQGSDPCISLYPASTYEALTGAALQGLNPLSSQARELKRMFHAWATDTELDSAGRVMLPPGHREHAGIDRQVMIVGAGESLELWDLDAWREYDTDLTARAPDLTNALGHPA